MTIIKSALSGVSWVASSTLIKGGLQLLQLIILARFLTPIELGITAAINLVIGFSQVFGDAGLSNAVIYHKSLNKSQLAQLYSVNLIFGALISTIVIVLAPVIASFFSVTELASLLVVLAPVFFIRSLSQQILAKLQQEMRFNLIAKIEVLSQVLAFSVVIGALLYEHTIWAVVYGQLTLASVLSICYLLFSNEHLLAPRRVHWAEVSEPIKYGLYQSGESLINYGSAQFDQLIVGKFLGPEKLGIYAYIKDLVFKPALQLINPIVNKVAFPLMVKFKESHSIKKMYLSMLGLLSYINIPLYSFIALFPELVLNAFFGADWVEHASVLQWLSLYMLLISVMNPVGVLMRASGEVKRAFSWNIGVSLVRPIVILLVISSGLISLTFGLFVLQVFLFLAHWKVLLQPAAQVGFSELLDAIKLPLLIAVCICAFIVIARLYIASQYQLLQAIISCALYMMFILPQLISQLKNLRS
ncbi:MOP flippase family protein [Pseudoalteromonas piscicida]|uniref:Polysaccharide transporter, PST family n=1 Tax=Pseudoalteromonas piscicida TaxID=43662 RepID=A0ABM6NJI0_PSEO7|nr:MOP flippase family protein [Pseudoalteromonas piscicida]ATD08939.1 polysaccharide transporter, PST family [Pseudoalteromonas piscicida]WPU30922.1 MOP flippase family protein [Pseudoalteromonas piscicida]